MKSARLFEHEVYIRLVENEPALVYTIRYGGFCVESTRLPLQFAPEIPADFEEESARVLRARRRFGGREQGEE